MTQTHITHARSLIDRLNQRTARVGVVGAGYVGLPLALEFAQAGFDTTVIDIDAAKVERINQGASYIPDVATADLAEMVLREKRLRGATSYDGLQQLDAVVICVPTPLDERRMPDMRFIESAVAQLRSIRHEGMLVVLESTTYPGTTQEVLLPQLADDEHRVGDTLFIAFSGERIDPGNQTWQLRNTPKVIGGLTPACTEVAIALYQGAVDTLVPVSSPTTAEMVKLMENTFRSVNIALANEMAIMCDHLGIDVWEVIDAARTKPFGFMAHYPGPGVGGHCIPIDPHYLEWKLRELGYDARFIALAGDINQHMPQRVVQKVDAILNQDSLSVKGARVLVLGVAYKADIDDVRESPALPVIEQLRQRGARVSYHDPHVAHIGLHDGAVLDSQPYSPDALQDADCIVIITPHRDYDWGEVAQCGQRIVDTRHVIDRSIARGSVLTV